MHRQVAFASLCQRLWAQLGISAATQEHWRRSEAIIGQPGWEMECREGWSRSPPGCISRVMAGTTVDPSYCSCPSFVDEETEVRESEIKWQSQDLNPGLTQSGSPDSDHLLCF